MLNRFPRLPRVLCFVLLVLTAGSGLRAEDKPAAKKHFLWKVKSKTATVYVLGSIHAAKKDLYPLDDVIESAFAKSDKVVFEVPLDAKTTREAQTKMMKAAQYEGDDSLDKHLSAEVKKDLADYLKGAKVPEAAFNKFRPWMVSLIVTMLELQKNGYSTGQGIDQHFMKKAEEKKKPVLGLETVDDQVNLFKNLDNKTQLKMLEQSLAESAEIGKTLDETFKAWKTGDPKKLEEVTLKSMRKPEYKALFKAMFVDRNRNMTKQIEGFLKSDSTYFVVVGSGHLVGKEGIIAMLKAKKYAVEQQ